MSREELTMMKGFALKAERNVIHTKRLKKKRKTTHAKKAKESSDDDYVSSTLPPSPMLHPAPMSLYDEASTE